MDNSDEATEEIRQPLPMAVPVGLMPAVPVAPVLPSTASTGEDKAEEAKEEKEEKSKLPEAAAAILAKLSAIKGPELPKPERMPEMSVGGEEGGGQASPGPTYAATLAAASAETVASLIQERGGLPLLEQTGRVAVGPGADKEAQLLGLGLPKLSSRQMDALAAAKKYAMEQSIKHVLLRQTAAHQANQQKIAMYAQALSLMARVYIGSISFEVREETIKQTFAPFGPIKHINMSWDPVTSHHKGFAFLEYDVPEAALLATDQMNGVLIGGRNVKVEPLQALKVSAPVGTLEAALLPTLPHSHPHATLSLYPQPLPFPLSLAHDSRFQEALPLSPNRIVTILFRLKVSSADEGVKMAFGQTGGGPRPTSMPQATPIIEMIMQEAKEYHRIYVSSIHPDLTETEVRSVFEAFGKVKTCVLAKTGPGQPAHRGYGYIEFESPSSVNDAVASMNLFDLGGQNLRVGKSITPPQAQSYVVPTSASVMPTAAAIAAAAVTAKIQAMEASAGSGPIAAGGTGQAPQVIIGATPDVLTHNPNQGALFSVPPAGIAVLNPASAPASSSNSPSRLAANGSNGSNSPSHAAVPPPGMVTIPGLASTPVPVQPAPVQPAAIQPPAAQPTAIQPTFAAPAAPPPAKPAAKAKAAPKAKAVGAPVVDSSGTALVLREDPMDILLGLKRHQKEEAKKSRKKPSKKKKGVKSEEEKAGEATESKVTAQMMATATTAQRIMASGALTEKQKEMLEMQAGASLAAQEDLKIKGNEARNILMHKLMRKADSRVVVLRNMVGAEDVDSELETDIQEECGKHGAVESVVIYQEKESEAPEAPVTVKIFVKFTHSSEAIAAKEALHDRWFAGRTVTADIYDQSLFDHNDLTG